MKRKLLEKKLSFTLLFFGSTVFFVSYFYGAGAVSTFKGPDAPPPALSNLDPVMDLSDLVSKSKLPKQSIAGPVKFFNSGSYPAWFGYTDGGSVQVGVMGIGQAVVAPSYIPSTPFASTPLLGAYGYAEGGASANTGAYGYSQSGAGVVGLVTGASDSAGKFFGPVRVENTESGTVPGTVNVARRLTANDGMTVNRASGVAIQYILTTGYRYGDHVVANSPEVVSLPAAVGNGAYGASDTSYGVIATSTDDSYAALGESQGPFGIYGYTGNGPGILAAGDATHTNARGVWAKSPDFGLYATGTIELFNKKLYVAGSGFGADVNVRSGAGIFACGTQTAATLNGNVRIFGGLTMGVASQSYVEELNTSDTIVGKIITPQVILTEAQLQQIAAQAAVTLPPSLP